MAALHKVAVARLTMRARQHLAAIRPVTGDRGPERVLALSTLGYADEILPLAGFEAPARCRSRLSRRATGRLALAERLIGALSGHFQPERYHDEHRAKVLAYLQHKADGAVSRSRHPGARAAASTSGRPLRRAHGERGRGGAAPDGGLGIIRRSVPSARRGCAGGRLARDA